MRVASEPGFVLVSILLTLVVIGGMYIYFTAGSEASELDDPMATRRLLACKVKLVSLDRILQTWAVTQPGQQPSIKKLKDRGVVWPKCPAGGSYTIQGDQVSCSLHGLPTEDDGV